MMGSICHVHIPGHTAGTTPPSRQRTSHSQRQFQKAPCSATGRLRPAHGTELSFFRIKTYVNSTLDVANLLSCHECAVHSYTFHLHFHCCTEYMPPLGSMVFGPFQGGVWNSSRGFFRYKQGGGVHLGGVFLVHFGEFFGTSWGGCLVRGEFCIGNFSHKKISHRVYFAQ